MYQNSFIQYLISLVHKALMPGKYHEQTFTYFIPSPPSRKTGYREKKFDSITQVLLENGFSIISINCESLSTEKSSGIWMSLRIRPSAKMATEIDINSLIDDLEFISQESELEGVYQLELEEGQ